MTGFIISAVLILLALAIILYVFIRHFPQAAAIDLDSLPAEQEAAMKAALMERRLKRKLSDTKQKFVPFFRRLSQKLKQGGKNIQFKVAQMEQRYRKKPHAMSTSQQEDVRQTIRRLLEEAFALGDKEEFDEAENKCIEVISWDPKNVQAYCELGQIYFAKKEFQQAKETFSYLFKLVEAQKKGEEAVSSFSSPLTEAQYNEAKYDYAVSLQVLGNLDGSKKEMNELFERDSKNPKYLDKMVELSILLKDRKAARYALEKLRKVNPENKKLNAFEEQIRHL